MKIDGSVLEEKSSFKMLGLTFSPKLDLGPYIISTVKYASKKIGAVIRSMKSHSLEVALHIYKSTIYPCMKYCSPSGLWPQVATWNCYTSYKSKYVGLKVLHLLLLLNPWLDVEMWPA